MIIYVQGTPYDSFGYSTYTEHSLIPPALLPYPWLGETTRSWSWFPSVDSPSPKLVELGSPPLDDSLTLSASASQSWSTQEVSEAFSFISSPKDMDM